MPLVDCLGAVANALQIKEVTDKVDALVKKGKHPAEAEAIAKREFVSDEFGKLNDELNGIKKEVGIKAGKAEKLKPVNFSELNKKYKADKEAVTKDVGENIQGDNKVEPLWKLTQDESFKINEDKDSGDGLRTHEEMTTDFLKGIGIGKSGLSIEGNTVVFRNEKGSAVGFAHFDKEGIREIGVDKNERGKSISSKMIDYLKQKKGIDKVLPPFSKEGNIIAHRKEVKKAIKENKYQDAISEGRMTANDAKAIIESAGLEVPKEILEKPNQEQGAQESDTTKMPQGTESQAPKKEQQKPEKQKDNSVVHVPVEKKNTAPKTYYQGIPKTTSFMQGLIDGDGNELVQGSMSDVERYKKENGIKEDNVHYVDLDTSNPNSLVNKFLSHGKLGDSTKRLPENSKTEKQKDNSVVHAQNIKEKFRQQFKAKGVSEEHIDGAIALMDARANSAVSNGEVKTPEEWYQRIADVKNGEFENSDIKYQKGGLKATIAGVMSMVGSHTSDANIGRVDRSSIDKSSVEIPKEDYEKTITVYDNREVDATSGKPMTDKNNLYSNANVGTAKEIVRAANKYDVDPYTMLAIAFQETGIAADGDTEGNPLHLIDNRADNLIDEGAKLFKEKMKIADSKGKKTEEERIQAFNGYGKVGKHTEGQQKSLYGIDVSKEPIDMNKNPVYGKRIIDIRDNIIKKNPELVKLVESERGNVAFQEQEGIKRGALETLKDGKVVIHALEKPDFSTMVHEIAHVFEKDLTEAEKKIMGDSEAFARGFERYLRDGKAPSEQLKTLFDKFKDWLTNIYKSLKGSPIEKKVSPELKQVFDRLLSEKQKDNSVVGSENKVNLISDESKKQNISTEENKGNENSSRPLDEKAVKQKLSELDEAEIVDPYDKVLHYFANDGKIHNSAIEKLFGGKDKRLRQNTSTENERRSRIGLIKKDAPTIEGLAHKLWEGDETGKYDTQDYKNAIEQVLLGYNSKHAMAKDLVEKYDYDAAYQKFIDQNYPKELIDKADKVTDEMSDEELNHLLQLSSDESHQKELEDYIDNLPQSAEKKPINTETDTKIRNADKDELNKTKQDFLKQIEELKDKTDEQSIRDREHLEKQVAIIDKFGMTGEELLNKLRNLEKLTSKCL